MDENENLESVVVVEQQVVAGQMRLKNRRFGAMQERQTHSQIVHHLQLFDDGQVQNRQAEMPDLRKKIQDERKGNKENVQKSLFHTIIK